MQPQGLEETTGRAPPQRIPRLLRLPLSRPEGAHTPASAHAGVPEEAACIYTARSVTPAIRAYLEAHLFPEVDFVAPEDVLVGVGVNRYAGAPPPLQPEEQLFTFLR